MKIPTHGGQVFPLGARRDSRSAGSIRRAPPRGAGRVKPVAKWSKSGHAHSAGPDHYSSIFPPFFALVFGMPFSRLFWSFWRPRGSPLVPFGHFGWILASILAPFWFILAPLGILFSGLDFASIFDRHFLHF